MSLRSVLDHDLLTIRDDILRMSSLVDQAMERAVKAFKKHDLEMAQAVVDDDKLIDDLHIKIEEQVTQTFATQQPMARDLRKLIADLLISNELERMGDHAEGVARAALRYTSKAKISMPTNLLRMVEELHNMMREVMDAYVSMDARKAKDVARLDDNVDALYQEFFSEIVTSMGKGKTPVEEGTYLLWVGHNLERIGDRVTNICERILYAHTGDVQDFNPKVGESLDPD